MSHASGIAHILRSRGYSGARNELEEKLLQAQRGSMVRNILPCHNID